MEQLLVKGGRPLRGRVAVSGSKNAALPLMMASILAEGEHRLDHVPDLQDVRTCARLLEGLGVRIERGRSRLRIHNRGLRSVAAPRDLVQAMRASVLCLGPLLGRYGRARVPLPGGCAIGARPIDQHLKGLARMGAAIELRGGCVEASARSLRGAEIDFGVVTVTGTENLLMAAALARGTTVLRNAAREPEVVQLAEALRAAGARITGEGSPVITVEGVTRLAPLRCRVIPDRIEAGTLLVAAAITRGDVVVEGLAAGHMGSLIAKLREAGVGLVEVPGGLRVLGPERPRAVDLETEPYPGFPTDMQAQLMALLCLAEGTSVLCERIFENRLMHVLELERMGARIRVEGSRAIVRGVARLSGVLVTATDLRASAGLVLAGLAAEGRTAVQRIHHLDRGYERLDWKLCELGADARRAPAVEPGDASARAA